MNNNGVKLTSGDNLQPPGESNFGFQTWLDARRNFIQGELARLASPPLVILNNGGVDYSVTNSPTVLLLGNAPIEVASLQFTNAATSVPVSWTSLTNWSVSLTLSNGANPIPSVVMIARPTP